MELSKRGQGSLLWPRTSFLWLDESTGPSEQIIEAGNSSLQYNITGDLQSRDIQDEASKSCSIRRLLMGSSVELGCS